MKNVLVINPWIYDFAAYDYWLKPLGLLYIASYLRENGAKVTFVDCLDPHLFRDELHSLPRRKLGGHGKFIKEVVSKPESLVGVNKKFHRYGVPRILIEKYLSSIEQPDVVITGTTMTYWYLGVWEIISLIKKVFPGTPVVLGGIYATLCKEHATLSGADIVLTGPGEKSVSFIIREVLKLPLTFDPHKTELDALPYPAFDLLPELDQVPILTSRGCPFSCSYCASSVLSPEFLRRNPNRVLEEIAYWSKTKGVKDFSIYDDAFLLDAEISVIPMLEEIVHQNFDLRFHCPNGLHARYITPKLAKLLFKAGFVTLRLGFETANEESQKKWGQKITNQELEMAVSYLREAGYEGTQIGVYILCGLPDQQPEEVLQSIRFVHNLGAKPILAEFSPVPGTALWEQSKRSSPYPLEREPLFHNNSLLPCWTGTIEESVFYDLKKLAHSVGKLKN
ncbi:MAG: B12-binding domain-containing radical SAM protein [Syntrophales bacterium]|nr:B12-binding domain-containing radical SAM protein [Syntrophales bacterium]